MSHPPLLGQSLQTAFEDANSIAMATFLAGTSIQVARHARHDIGVEFDALTQAHILHTSAYAPFVASMAELIGNYQDAWLLTLAHESGHVRLNQACVDAGLAPGDANSQMFAMGIKLDESQAKWLPHFHKESAIEAYCDACLLQYAAKHYLSQWIPIATKLLNIRTNHSANFQRSPEKKRYGDDYFCCEPIRLALSKTLPISETDAAKIALLSSIENTPLPLDILNASHIAIDDLADRLKPKAATSHQKAIHSSVAALGRVQAAYHNIKAKLAGRRPDVTGECLPPPGP